MNTLSVIKVSFVAVVFDDRVMDSHEGEMTPGKKIGSKYSIVMKI